MDAGEAVIFHRLSVGVGTRRRYSLGDLFINSTSRRVVGAFLTSKRLPSSEKFRTVWLDSHSTLACRYRHASVWKGATLSILKKEIRAKMRKKVKNVKNDFSMEMYRRNPSLSNPIGSLSKCRIFVHYRLKIHDGNWDLRSKWPISIWRIFCEAPKRGHFLEYYRFVTEMPHSFTTTIGQILLDT